MEDNKTEIEKIRNEYWYEFEKVEDNKSLTEKAYQLGSNEGPAASTNDWKMEDNYIYCPEYNCHCTDHQCNRGKQCKVMQLNSDEKQLLDDLLALPPNVPDNAKMEDKTPLTAEAIVGKKSFAIGRRETVLFYHDAVEAAKTYAASLQERVAELEREKKELMGLLEIIFKNFRIEHNIKGRSYNEAVELTESDWQSFCKEKGISPSPPEADG